MLYLVRFELQDGENSYTDLKLIQSDSEELAGFAADEYLRNYFDDETEMMSDNWAVHKCGYPAVKLKGFEEIRDFEHLIERVGYIGEKPQLDKHVYCICESDIDDVIDQFQEDEQIELTPEQRQLVIGVVADWDFSNIWDDIVWDIKAVLNIDRG